MNDASVATAESLFDRRHILRMACISLGYLSIALIGFRPSQVWLLALVNICYFASLRTRRLIIGFSIFVVYWVIFDYMKAFPNYWFNEVHTGSLYELERSMFGVSNQGILLTPNEYIALYSNTFLDILSGLFYLSWIPVPLIFGVYLFKRNRTQFFYFSLSFLLINLLGFVIYYLYPAAPPWYIQQYGTEVFTDTPGNTAALARFDDFFHVGIFHGLYAQSSNVFAAMPSLHSSYPVLVLFYGLKNKLGRVNIFFAIVMIGIWLSAVYTNHHYVLDVLAGILCAICGIWLFLRISRTGWCRKFIQRMVILTER
jgi:membrane-associated phospholipid phosphatase